MLQEDLKNQLKQYLELLESDVTFSVSLDEESDSKEMRDFLEDVTSLSNRLSIKEEKHELTPSFELLKNGEKVGIRFAGIPLGHEFQSFVLALLQASGRKPKISDEDIERIKSIEEEINFTTFVSLTCHNCPDVVQSLNIMSVLNPKISHTMVEGGSFKELAEKKNVMAVPFVFKNDEEFSGGKISLKEILDKLDVKKVSTDRKQVGLLDVLVLGGGPAAGTAAIYSARKGIKTAIVCKEFGGQVNETLGIENVPGIKYTEGPKYMASMKEHVKSYPVEIFEGVLAESFKKLENQNIEVSLSDGSILESKSVIIATGARWRLLKIKGETELKNKGVAYCPHCDGPLFKDKKVAVIGGGNSGVEAAIDLANLAKEVVVIEYADKLNADQVLQDKLYSLKNVEVITSAQTTEISGETKVTGLDYNNRLTSESHHLDLDGVFILVGLVPNTEWINGQLEMTRLGEIITKKDGSTNIEGVFAAGDCTDQMFKQIVISEGSGATAALGAFNYLMRK